MKIQESNAFVENFYLPPKGSGPLSGLTFGVKDLIDVKGYRTGCGNRTWTNQQQTASVNAICVDQLLFAGASCIGKTVTQV